MSKFESGEMPLFYDGVANAGAHFDKKTSSIKHEANQNDTFAKDLLTSTNCSLRSVEK